MPEIEKALLYSAKKKMTVPSASRVKVIKSTIFVCRLKILRVLSKFLFLLNFLDIIMMRFAKTVKPRLPVIISMETTRQTDGIWVKRARLSE